MPAEGQGQVRLEVRAKGQVMGKAQERTSMVWARELAQHQAQGLATAQGMVRFEEQGQAWVRGRVRFEARAWAKAQT